jgi:uncharacterized membrane protein AbrB (regulator of aidB expression)
LDATGVAVVGVITADKITNERMQQVVKNFGNFVFISFQTSVCCSVS